MKVIRVLGRAKATGFQTFRLWMLASLQICCLAGFASSAMAETLILSLPLQCTLHKTCFIQNYVDIDPSPGIQDYHCGQAAYDGHKGTDFRVVSAVDAQKGVAVIAAAAGRVKALRDGIQDRLIDKTTTSPKGRECGNGVVIDHGQGWETQYCHMRQGSIRVRKGQQLERGTPIGLVGYSGKAQFAHLHLSVRHKGGVIDPFTSQGADGRCGRDVEQGLWQAGTKETLQYRRGELIEVGFADRPVGSRDLEEGKAVRSPVLPVAKAIVFYARFINLEKDDRLRLVLKGPSGLLAQNTTKPLKRHEAQSVIYVGRKLRNKRWPSGSYRGQVQLLRSGAVMLDQEMALFLE